MHKVTNGKKATLLGPIVRPIERSLLLDHPNDSSTIRLLRSAFGPSDKYRASGVEANNSNFFQAMQEVSHVSFSNIFTDAVGSFEKACTIIFGSSIRNGIPKTSSSWIKAKITAALKI
jgi:hypothetical protein